MNADEEGFLARLAEDEDDEATRLVYSDWLEENGRVEECERQRAWAAAKAWIVHLCEEHGQAWGGHAMPYAELMTLTTEAVESGAEPEIYIRFGSAEGMADWFRGNSPEFWRNWSIVTGRPAPSDPNNEYYSCAC